MIANHLIVRRIFKSNLLVFRPHRAELQSPAILSTGLILDVSVFDNGRAYTDLSPVV